jgi:hypothetical protein
MVPYSSACDRGVRKKRFPPGSGIATSPTGRNPDSTKYTDSVLFEFMALDGFKEFTAALFLGPGA